MGANTFFFQLLPAMAATIFIADIPVYFLHKHPDKESLAKIIHHNPNTCLMFNYEFDFSMLFDEQDRQEYQHISYLVKRRNTERTDLDMNIYQMMHCVLYSLTIIELVVHSYFCTMKGCTH